MHSVMDFEKPIIELENKIKEFESFAAQNNLD